MMTLRLRHKISTLVVCCLLVTAAFYFQSYRDPAAIWLPSSIYEEYCGYYSGQDESYVLIRREGERLMAYIPEKGGMHLQPETTSTFFVKGKPGRYVFERDDQNHVASLLAVYPKFQVRATRMLTDKPPYKIGKLGMVVASTGGSAVNAGIDILKSGGSAADAAMTTALSEVVLAGGSTISFAGAMQFLYFDATTGTVYYLDGWYNTPLAETDPLSIPDKGGRTAMVPGFMAVVQAAHDRFGKVPFARLFEPAIQLAEKGTPVDKTFAWWIDQKKNTLSRSPETKKIFCRPDGQFLKLGDTFYQPAVAATLRGVAAHGADFMYSGEWGRHFVAAVQQQGGKIKQQDMQNYKVISEQPVQTSYNGYQIFGPGLSAVGGVQIVEAFNLIAAANLRSKGQCTTSAETLVWLMQIFNLDREIGYSTRRVLDRDLTPQSRLTTETAAWMWDKMQTGKWPWLPKDMAKESKRPKHSSGVVAVDRCGNMAVVAHTINTNLWGDTGLFVDGVSIPDSAIHNREEIKAAGPGRRLPGRMVPLLILHNAKPVIGCSATGVGHTKTIQVLLNMLDYGMDPRTAVDTPAFLLRGQVAEDTYAPELLEQARALGMPIDVIKGTQADKLRGNWLGVQWDPSSEEWRGAASLGPPAQVMGY